jgi:hypothetical protein
MDTLPTLALTEQLMQRTLQQAPIVLPFAQDIFLLETHVAGLRYYGIKNLAVPLEKAAPLVLRREPSNRHDNLAIEVLTATGGKLGYVPQHRNPVIARLMDAGKMLVAEVARLQYAHDGTDRHTDKGNENTVVDVRFNISLRE